MKNQDLIPTRVTYINPRSGKTLSDPVLDIDYRLQKVTIQRFNPHSTAPMILSFEKVVSFEFPACPNCFTVNLK